ncbi:hypothetical protein ABK040_013351 [Willaertia magna]
MEQVFSHSDYTTNINDPQFRFEILESEQHIHIGNFAAVTLQENKLNKDANNNIDNNSNKSTDSLTIDGISCFLDGEYQDYKNKLLQQQVTVPKSSLSSVHMNVKKEISNFVKLSKSIQIIDKPNDEINKTEFLFLNETWSQMFKLPQIMLRYSGKHDSFWRGNIFSNLYRFILRDFDMLFDENRELTVTINNTQKKQLDGIFYIGLHQKRQEIRELFKLLRENSPSPSVGIQNQNSYSEINQLMINGVFLPFFCSKEMNDVNGSQYQAENELALSLKTFLDTQYRLFKTDKNRKRMVTGLTCVGPMVTAYLMRRFEANNENNNNGAEEYVYIMQPLDSFNLLNFDDVLRCAKYLTSVRKYGADFQLEVKNKLRTMCGLQPIKPQQSNSNGNINQVNGKENGSSNGQIQQDSSNSKEETLKKRQQQQQIQRTPQNNELKRKQTPSPETRSSNNNANNNNQQLKKQKMNVTTNENSNFPPSSLDYAQEGGEGKMVTQENTSNTSTAQEEEEASSDLDEK